MIGTLITWLAVLGLSANAPPRELRSFWDLSLGVVSATPTFLPSGMALGGSADIRWGSGTFWTLGLRADLASVSENDNRAVVHHLETRALVTAHIYTTIEMAEVGIQLALGPSIVWESRTLHNAQRFSIDSENHTRVFASGQLEAVVRLPIVANFWIEISAGPQSTWIHNQLGAGITATGRVRWRP